MMKYRLQRISTLSIARFGCLLGWIVTVIPSLTCGLVTWRVVVAIRTWLEGWEQIDLSLFGFDYTFDLVDLLQLKELLASLQVVEGRALPLLIALMIAAGVLGGVLIAFVLILLGWGYNLLAWATGGIEVELGEVSNRHSSVSALPTQRR
jgi:hypothetical protein